MFVIDKDKSISITRGDCCNFPVTAVINGEAYQFQVGDVVRFKAFRKKDCTTLVLQRDFEVEEETYTVTISLAGDDTKIGKVISKPVDYWYEVELNPDTNPQTIVGYDDDGPKVFKLFPEGKDVDGDDIAVVGSKTLQELVDYTLEQANKSGAFKGDKGDKGDKGERGDTGDVTPEAVAMAEQAGREADRAENAAEASKNAAVSAEASKAEAKEQANRAEYLVKGLEGVFVLQKGEGEDSIVQISTTGTDNKSYAPAGTALGMNAVSGIKGFHMVSVDTENLLITVDDAELEEKAAKVYAEGDVLQFDAKGHNYFKLEIVRLATNDEGHSVIGVKKTTEETLNLTLAADPKENYCWVVGKNYGEIFTMARAAHTEGESAISAGRAAHAEGRQTRAIGAYAHAEGRETVANYAAHAEGESTTASGRFSHAEGDNTKAVGEASHAEGQLTQAIGEHAHAEGQSTKAKGMYSHAEGVYTATKGYCSHGEGVGTIATGSGQHVQGRYNIEDTGSKYAHIVGGGNSDTDRKNIHTIDWQGNAEFAGDHITVGGKTLTAATIKLLEGLTVSEGVAF